MLDSRSSSFNWPQLNWPDWSTTANTLHMWTQIVGKTRLALTPMQQHWWNVPLYVSVRGLTTSPMPVSGELLEIEFDFTSQQLTFRLSSGWQWALPLKEQSVREFYKEYLAVLQSLGLPPLEHPVPVEVKDPIPFAEDEMHATYDSQFAYRFWRVLVGCQRVFQNFSSDFIGKISPVHFFWGSFDLAVTRFSGRPAPPREGADLVTREAYSEEVISAGFWPGNGGYEQAAFYCYAVPSPEDFSRAAIEPKDAYFDTKLGEFLLRYTDVQRSASPERSLMQFLKSTYNAGADLAGWNRARLERQIERK